MFMSDNSDDTFESEKSYTNVNSSRNKPKTSYGADAGEQKERAKAVESGAQSPINSWSDVWRAVSGQKPKK